MPLFAIFIIIPFFEIAVFMLVGSEIGLLSTLLLALLTALIGSAIIRHQGMQALSEAQKHLQNNQLPGQEIFDGFCLIAAGALLITPGFVTDTIGFLLLVPGLRSKARNLAGQHFKFDTVFTGDHSRRNHSDSDVIEGDYETIDIDEKTQ